MMSWNLEENKLLTNFFFVNFNGGRTVGKININFQISGVGYYAEICFWLVGKHVHFWEKETWSFIYSWKKSHSDSL